MLGDSQNGRNCRFKIPKTSGQVNPPQEGLGELFAADAGVPQAEGGVQLAAVDEAPRLGSALHRRVHICRRLLVLQRAQTEINYLLTSPADIMTTARVFQAGRVCCWIPALGAYTGSKQKSLPLLLTILEPRYTKTNLETVADMTHHCHHRVITGSAAMTYLL